MDGLKSQQRALPEASACPLWVEGHPAASERRKLRPPPPAVRVVDNAFSANDDSAVEACGGDRIAAVLLTAICAKPR